MWRWVSLEREVSAEGVERGCVGSPSTASSSTGTSRARCRLWGKVEKMVRWHLQWGQVRGGGGEEHLVAHTSRLPLLEHPGCACISRGRNS